MSEPMPLTTVIKPYPWGSSTAFPRMFGTEPTGDPQAELWIGAHPSGPSRFGGRPLTDLIRDDPAGMLGEPSVERFGPTLPYLLKVLAVERPLSLQVHPSSAQAKAGYAREQRAGIGPDETARTYKDPFAKPEMVCAITCFHGLCGFRSAADAADLLDSLGVEETAEWSGLLRADPAQTGLRAVFADMLDDRSAPVRQAVERALARTGPHLRRHDEHLVYARVAEHHPGDAGVAAALLLRQVRLEPGQALFLGAGVPHAYLGGLAVEIMANSDNVLRCGLTGKHRDVAELMQVVDFRPSAPHLIAAAGQDGRSTYRPPVAEFSLDRHELDGQATVHALDGGAPRIVLCVQGEARLRGGDRPLHLRPGQSAFVPAREPAIYLTGRGVVFSAQPQLARTPGRRP